MTPALLTQGHSFVAFHSDPLFPTLLHSVQVTHDAWKGITKPAANLGLIYLRPTPGTLAFMRAWLARRVAQDSRDQYEFDAAVEAAVAAGQGLSVHFLDKGAFPNGCCCGRSLPKKRAEADAWLMWHAACAGDLPTKLGILERMSVAAAKRRTEWRLFGRLRH